MGFEVVVRPAVFPNIRPQRPGLSMPGDAPDKGFATISGGGASLISLPWSESVSMSKGHKERRRTYVKVRIPTTKPNGDLDWGNYSEYEVATRIESDPNFEIDYDQPQPKENMRIMGKYSRNADNVD